MKSYKTPMNIILGTILVLCLRKQIIWVLSNIEIPETLWLLTSLMFALMIRACSKSIVGSKDLPWAGLVIFVSSFWCFFKSVETFLGNKYHLTILYSAIAGVVGIIVCLILTAWFENMRRNF